jgi:hypothetical protein
VFRVQVLLAGALLLAAAVSSPALAQEDATDRDDRKPPKYTTTDVQRVVRQLAHDTYAFRAAAARDVAPADLEDVPADDRLEPPVKEFDKALDRLRTRLDVVDDWWKTVPEAKATVQGARDVNAVFARVYAYGPVRRNWIALQKQINVLADMYRLHPLRVPPVPPEPPKKKAKEPEKPQGRP